MSSTEVPHYKRTILHKTEAFEIVACEWSQSQLAGFHHHGWSQCLVLVQEGLFENTLDFGIRRELSLVEPGQLVQTPVGARHDIRCMSAFGRTLHVYVPALKSEANLPRFATPATADIRAALDLELKDEGLRSRTFQELLKDVQNWTVSTQSPYFMNQLFSGTLAEMIEAERILAQTKTTMATFEASPVFTMVELEVIQKLGALIGWSEGHREGVNVPGGSAANFMAVHCARHNAFPEFKRTGSQGQRLKVFVSAESHYSFQKACAALGIGTDNLVSVACDESGRMCVKELDERILECERNGDRALMVVATAGTTVLGAFDPIAEIANVCEHRKVWLHVDAAWGGPALFSKACRSLVEGIERADSVCFDAHKLFGANLTCAFFLTRHSGLLLDANDVAGGDYLFHADKSRTDLGRLSWQCGRRPDAFTFWALWKSHGTAGLGEFVDRLIQIRTECVDWILVQDRLELVSSPSFLNICVRVTAPSGQADWSLRVREALIEQNLAMVNYSQNADGPFLRLILAHPYLETQNVTQILEWALALR